MRALVVNHDNHCPAGMVGERLEHHGIDLVELALTDHPSRPASDVAFPDPTRFDLVVVMGSPWSVYDRATIGTWIDRELDLLRSAVAADVPVLGICFGAQALATALGAEVERAPAPELGWYEVTTAAPDLVAAGPWFQWHVDRFGLPAGAVALASGPQGVQAFRHGRHLATQFHPELTAEILRGWLATSHAEELALLPASADELLAETARRQEEARPRVDALVDGWLRDVARLVRRVGA